MLGRPAVAAEIARRRAAQSKAADVEGKDVLRALSRIAFFDVRKLFEVDGTPKRITDLDDATAAAVVGVDVVTVGNREVGYGKVMRVKLADKVRALELLGRHLGLFAEMSFEVKGGVHVYIPANGRDQTAGKGA
jgi:phage terminase small subunit